MTKRRGLKVDGWLNLDKPLGLSSAQAVARARRLFGAAKVGHGGTLDPLASGVLPIAFGEATKTVAWVMDGPKAYRFTLRFGIATATDDAEGEIVATSDVRPDDAALAAILPGFRGRIEQRPPAFSALKVAGQRAYALARAGAVVDLAPRQVDIHALELLERTSADLAVLQVRCGKGTYIRSLARDIAQVLGTVGHVAALRRTACGPFAEGESVTLDALAAAAGRDASGAQGHDLAGNSLSPVGELGHTSALFGYLRPVVTALDDIPALALTDREAQRLSQGMAVKLPEAGVRPAAPIGTMSPAEESAGPGTGADKGVVRAMAGDRLVAIARIDAGLVRPVRVLNL
ncbi:tRNA pseudouridine(55) synthase TruB [Vineibacter terrae]|uniref:tRNA pseudouridine synthase B n=1 Tax=Vineibacter terrae TaxID=2586908 RepID=A0A5C8P9F1_9HYPH|nr:tRNA pseudouridine(55) synthase TruB [Vineibacter terrae]TXL70193.1 tRNA pseudouridine(55) synthase TruB [Vineibacter terrae]